MKLNLKILTAFILLILFSVIFCITTVSAVGNVSQGWIIVDAATQERALVFRLYNSPHSSTVKNYTNTNSSEIIKENGKQLMYITSNGNEVPAKWVYSNSISYPTKATYGTARLVFHKDMFCDYSKNGGAWAYNKPKDGFELNYQIATIQNAVNNSQTVYTTPKETGKNKEIYSITRIGGTFSSWRYGTKLVMQNLYAGELTGYRYALVRIGTSKSNVYIGDKIVRGEHLNNLITKLDGAQSCFVTEELISKAIGSNPYYEVSKTAYKFTQQANKNWSANTKGTTNNAMGSALNVYDNELRFPTSSSRQVYIKHINIGTGDVIDLTKVNNGIHIDPSVTKENYILVDDKKTTSNLSKTGYDEYYEGIDIESSITKYALDLDKLDIECLGYNVGVAVDLSSAQSVVSSQVQQSRYITDDVVSVEGKTTLSNDDVIVIEFYYTEGTKDEESTPEETGEPEKGIGGRLFVESPDTDTQSAVCDDTEGYPVTSVPSGSDVKIGIEDIPQYMAGAINVQEQEKEHTVTVNLKYKAGPYEETVTYTMKYAAIYYNIPNMLIYKFNEIKVYDANKGYDTIGDSLFNWSETRYNGIRKDAPQISLTGINEKSISNTTNSIANESNYVSAILKANNKTYNITGQDDYTITVDEKTYLTEAEFTKSDVNKDEEITTHDKDYVASIVQDTKDDMEDAEEAMSDAKAAKEAAEKAMNDAEAAKEAAEKTMKNAKTAKEKAWEMLKKYEEELVEPENEYKLAKKNMENSVGYKAISEVNQRKEAFKKEFNLEPTLKNLLNIQKPYVETCSKTPCPDNYNIYCAIYCRAERMFEAYTKAQEEYNNLDDEEITEYKRLTDVYNSAKREYDVAKQWRDGAEKDYEAKSKAYTAAEDAYEEKAADLTTATKNYNTKSEAYSNAQSNYNNKTTAYNNQVAYQKEFLTYFENYLNLYNDYIEITSLSKSQLAEKYNIVADIKVKNMKVVVGEKNLHNQNSEATKTIEFKNLLPSQYEISTSKITIDNDIYDNLTNETIERSNYDNSYSIHKSVTNGVRGLAGKAIYVTESVIGSATEVWDTAYTEGKTFSLNSDKTLEKEYKVHTNEKTLEEKYKEVLPVNVYTPITVSTSISTDKKEVVDQTAEKTPSAAIQINTPFTITISSTSGESVYGFGDTTNYSQGYYLKFDFDVHKVKVDGKSYMNGNKINAGTWIGILKPSGNNGDVKVEAQAYGSTEDTDLNIISEENGSYTARAVAYNAEVTLRNTSKLYPTLKDFEDSASGELIYNICNPQSYFAETTGEVSIINRMYGFRVTDVKDLEWKSTFRNTSGSTVNKHTGNVYYTGTTKWDVSSLSEANRISNRTASEIGRNPLRILPIGPYKNTDISKFKAPKLGYRFSYDFKVTGAYYNSDGTPNKDKTASINTSFYYISKDGKTFIPESTGGEGIYLFYKNSSGKYVRIGSSGDNYELKFTPNDGYRYIEDIATSSLATTPVSIGTLRKITLTHNMSTPTNNRAAITYYGEYKLPNSTIAVEVDSNGKYDINKPLTDGYIGVVFDIKATDKKTNAILSYNKNTNGTNTSQWDYEGFLGFTNHGKDVTAGEMAIRLEKGTWQITNDIYNKIKGTVILYDIDERAATDYE